MPINMMDGNHRIASVLVGKHPFSDMPKAEGEGEVHEDAAELELTREILEAIKSGKAEKLNKALMLLIRMCYDNYENEEEEFKDESPRM